jgi:hypothetical protein
MNRFMVLVVATAALCLLMGVTAVNAQIPFVTYPMTTNTADDASADVAVDVDGNLHTAFVRGGNVYSMVNLEPEELVGAGDSPAIAVSAAGIPHVVSISGGVATYRHRASGSWSSAVTLAYGDVNVVDIDVDGAGKAHIVYSCNLDGDSYREIVYANNVAGGFTEWTLADGWYDSGSGNYFANPCIKVNAAGNYRIAMEADNWGGRASWSSKSILFLSPEGAVGSEGYDWNGGVTTGKNSIALDGAGNAHVLYYSGSTILHAVVAGGWTGGALATGSQGAIACSGSSIAVAFNDGSNHIQYMQDIGSGFGSPQTVDDGRYPSIALNGSRHIVYEKSDGSDYEIVLAADEAPLPIQLASFTALTQGEAVSLQWQTISELNNYGFTVQRRSADGVTYTDIPGSFIAGHGTTTEAQVYTFVDSNPQGEGWYRLSQVDLDGRVHYSEPIQVSSVTDVDANEPVTFSLAQNYPNPFNPATQISFGIAAAGQVRLVVYDQLGREVATLVDGVLSAGQHAAAFNAAGLASGVYFARLTSGAQTSMIRMMLMK